MFLDVHVYIGVANDVEDSRHHALLTPDLDAGRRSVIKDMLQKSDATCLPYVKLSGLSNVGICIISPRKEAREGFDIRHL